VTSPERARRERIRFDRVLMVNRHDRTQIWRICDGVDCVYGQASGDCLKTRRVRGLTSSTVKDMTADVTDVRQALKTIEASAGDHSGAAPVPVGHAHPRESSDGRLMHTEIAHGRDGYACRKLQLACGNIRVSGAHAQREIALLGRYYRRQ
jgi:hypothetical protein